MSYCWFVERKTPLLEHADMVNDVRIHVAHLDYFRAPNIEWREALMMQGGSIHRKQSSREQSSYKASGKSWESRVR